MQGDQASSGLLFTRVIHRARKILVALLEYPGVIHRPTNAMQKKAISEVTPIKPTREAHPAQIPIRSRGMGAYLSKELDAG